MRRLRMPIEATLPAVRLSTLAVGGLAGFGNFPASPRHTTSINGNKLHLTMPRSPVVGYARSIFVNCLGYFLIIERLFPPSTGGLCKAFPAELGEPAVETKPSKKEQDEFSKPPQAVSQGPKRTRANALKPSQRLRRVRFRDPLVQNPPLCR